MPPKTTIPATCKPSAWVATKVAKAAEAALDVSLAADPAAAPQKTWHSPEEVKEAKQATAAKKQAAVEKKQAAVEQKQADAAKKKDDEVRHANMAQRVAQLELELLCNDLSPTPGPAYKAGAQHQQATQSCLVVSTTAAETDSEGTTLHVQTAADKDDAPMVEHQQEAAPTGFSKSKAQLMVAKRVAEESKRETNTKVSMKA